MVTRNRRAASRRQQRVGEAIRRTLGEMLLRQEIQDPELNQNSITITEVRISADLREATVFFLPLGGRDAETAGRALERNRGPLQHAAQRKFAPRLRFVPDPSYDHFERINQLLASDGSMPDPGSG